jgi:hypothetical protein
MSRSIGAEIARLAIWFKTSDGNRQNPDASCTCLIRECPIKQRMDEQNILTSTDSFVVDRESCDDCELVHY